MLTGRSSLFEEGIIMTIKKTAKTPTKKNHKTSPKKNTHHSVQETNEDPKNDEPIDVLSELMQLDIDAVEAYEQALKHIETPRIHKQIKAFKQDHQQHIEDLSIMIQSLGGNPPECTKDFKGFFIKGMTTLRSLMGEEAALKAMRSNEELTNKTYQEALQHKLPRSAQLLIKKNYKDEQRHLAYITSLLDV